MRTIIAITILFLFSGCAAHNDHFFYGVKLGELCALRTVEKLHDGTADEKSFQAHFDLCVLTELSTPDEKNTEK